MILFCGIKAEEDMHQICLLFFHVQALHWTSSSSFMFAPFLTDSPLFRLAAVPLKRLSILTLFI